VGLIRGSSLDVDGSRGGRSVDRLGRLGGGSVSAQYPVVDNDVVVSNSSLLSS